MRAAELGGMMESQLSTSVISTEDLDTILELFAQYLVDSRAKDILLLDKGGRLLAKSGAVTQESALAISALAAGVFSSMNELARLVGEPEFVLTLHQGKETSVLVSLVNPDTLLVVIFDTNAPVGAVQFWAKKIAISIIKTLNGTAALQSLEPSGTAGQEPGAP